MKRSARQVRSDGDQRADAFIPVAMLAVSAAAAVASNLHFGLELELAAACGLTLFSALLILHIVLRRKPAQDEAMRDSLEPHRSGPLELAERGAAGRRRPAPPLASNQNIPQAIADAIERGEPGPVGVPPGLRPDAFAPGWEPYPEASPAAEAAPAPRRPIEPAFGPLPSEARPAPWDFRPGPPRPSMPPPDFHADFGPRVAPPALAEDESAAIDQILKRLAAQIQSGAEEVARSELTAARAAPPAAASDVVQAAALASAVESLRTAAGAMRHGEPASTAEPAAAHRGPPPPPTPPASPAEDRLAAVADALARERIDVYLEPILGLADERARHFEVTVRLKDAAGETFEPDDVVRIGRGAGLLPLLDALRVRHSAGLAMRLERRGRDGKVFSSITSEALESRQFLADVAERRGQRELVTDRLVLAFEQNVVRTFAPAQWTALGNLRDLGFRFSLQSLADLDMDFAALKAGGFEFIKLDAAVFLQGLPLGQGVVPASDLCRHMASLGLAVIVGRIGSEAERARVQDYGVQFGQGWLFGLPRPINLAGGGAVAGAAA